MVKLLIINQLLFVLLLPSGYLNNPLGSLKIVNLQHSFLENLQNQTA